VSILWARHAYDDLDGIANYLAGLSKDAAERIIGRIQDAVLLLGKFPRMGARVDDTGLRKLVFPKLPTSYSIESLATM
jgi:plasmid stabilization system protein ParE